MESEKSLNKIVIGLIIVIIAITAFFIFKPNSGITGDVVYESPKGEEFGFVKSQIGNIPIYTLTVYVHYSDQLIKPYEIPLRNQPKDLEEIPIQDGIRTKILSSTGIFLTMDPNLDAKVTVAAIQLAKVLGNADFGVFKIPTQGAFTSLEETAPDYPVITCNNATAQTKVILLEQGDENKASIEGNCVIIEGTDPDNLIKVSEKVVLNLLNVM